MLEVMCLVVGNNQISISFEVLSEVSLCSFDICEHGGKVEIFALQVLRVGSTGLDIIVGPR